MKKLFLSILFVFACIAMANAAPAQPGWRTFTQSDGKTVTLQLVGDEWSSATLTRDGLMVTRDKDGDFYYYSSLTGRTAMRAHDEEHRTAVETAFIEAQRQQFKYEYKRKNISRMSTRFNAPHRTGGSNEEADACPAKGDRSIPVILVEFKNRTFTHNKEEIVNSMLMGDKSVGKYFRDQSNNQYKPTFEVVGPYKLSENFAYYGANDGNGNDLRPDVMVKEALDSALKDNVKFLNYSNMTEEGVDLPYLDAVIIIYAGYGENYTGADNNLIWPHRGFLFNTEVTDFYSVDGVYAWQYAVFNELNGLDSDNSTEIDGIGVFCHEFSHCLGLPDFYDTEDQSRHYGMGHWSLMCVGGNIEGHGPIGYNAYEKHFMGWLDYTYAVPGTTYTLPVWNTGNDRAICIQNELNSNEYFLYEYRKPVKGGWDEYIPDKNGGIMVTHVSYVPGRWKDNNVNNRDVQLMTILPADGVLTLDSEDKDLWPKAGKTEITNASSPATTLYLDAAGNVLSNAGLLGKPVTNIRRNTDGTMSFDFMAESAKELSSSTSRLNFGLVKCGAKKTNTITISGRNLMNDITLSITGANADKFTVEKTTIPVAPVCTNEGYTFSVTYTPAKMVLDPFSDFATLNIRSGDKYIAVSLVAKASIFGDKDGDGRFNIDDVTAVISYLLSGEGSPLGESLSIDDVTALINYLLSGETTVDLDAGLVAYYPMDGNARDMSGNGNHGIATNVTSTTGVTGEQGGAYRFDGTDNPGYIRVPNSASLQFSDGFTFSCFVKPMGWGGMDGTGSVVANGNHCIFAKSNDRTGPAMLFSGNDDGLHVWCGSVVDQCQWANIGSSDYLNNGDYLNKWVHVAVSYSASKRKSRLFVNGNLIQEKYLSTPVDYSLMNGSDLYLGRFKTSSWWNPMNGAIDEVRIYNRALGIPEVQELAGSFITDAGVSLSESVVVMAVGEEVRVKINNGCGNYSIGSCPDVVDCRLEGETIILTGMGEGTTNVTFNDIDSHTHILLPVTVVRATKTYTVNGVSFTMVPVLGGTFTMGATTEQGTDASSNEKPAHVVTLSNYYIGQTEVTQELWQAVMGTNPSMFKGDLLRPVENVSWNDCQSFIAKLNELTGENFRLPTEAEWEYAARGDGVSQGYKYAGGNKISEVAWWGCGYDENSDAGNSAYTTHPVGLKIANELSLYDMSGNVYEWCQDWYGSYSSGAQVNPTGPASGSNRITRGGGWGYGDVNCRVSHRMSCSPTYRHPAIGLRLAL